MKYISFLKSFLVSFILLFMLVSPSIVFGQDIGLEYGRETGLANRDVRSVVVSIINVSLSLLGTVSVCLILYAGFKWMTSMGNDSEIESAKKILTASVIGLLVILSAYAITQFVLTNVLEATTNIRRF